MFKNADHSHEHSRFVLDRLAEHTDFLRSLRTIVDVGSGAGLDARWWADTIGNLNITNHTVYAVDRDEKSFDSSLLTNNIQTLTQDYEQLTLPKPADLIWCHNSFQYCLNPLQTLKQWNLQMKTDAMLVLTVPLHVGYKYNRLQTRSYSGCYYSYNICNIIHMLAVNGFDVYEIV